MRRYSTRQAAQKIGVDTVTIANWRAAGAPVPAIQNYEAMSGESDNQKIRYWTDADLIALVTWRANRVGSRGTARYARLAKRLAREQAAFSDLQETIVAAAESIVVDSGVLACMIEGVPASRADVTAVLKANPDFNSLVREYSRRAEIAVLSHWARAN